VKLFLVAALLPTICFGKVIGMPLCDIAERSDVVTLATITQCETRADRELCQLNEQETFKGNANAAVCTDISYVEARPLTQFEGKRVLLFLRNGKGCFTVTGANRGIIPVVNSIAYTVSIFDLDWTTKLPELVSKLRNCMHK